MIKKIPLTSVVALGLAIAAVWPEFAQAQIAILPENKADPTTGNTPLGDLDFSEGNVHLRHIPGLILHWIQVLLQLAGTFAVVMIMVGGAQYMIGAVSNDKEQGKKTLTYALGGLAVAFFAWWIVELIQVWMTTA